ncbi:helix-turn-helix domain-containing protein [Nocardioides fonticola]|uniref:Helix-turn-helix domain-containing protein n=1 Tax=Nocardioides fonticola TaxID=450363 RepID=A0ABP7XLN4_9ACTN
MARRYLSGEARPGVSFSPALAAEIRAELPRVADDVVRAIIEGVPSYADAFSGPMGETIRTAVQVALGGFVSLASGRRGVDLSTPTATAVEGAYQLGRGEARSGRTTDAILAAYRIGARLSWRELSTVAVRHGIDGTALVEFAELVFAFIDELSAASVAGHADELADTGRVRQQRLERLADHLLAGAPSETLTEAAERADWPTPTTLTAVLVPRAQVRPVLGGLPAETIAVDRPELDDLALLLVPDVHERRRGVVQQATRGRGCTLGPPKPWRSCRVSYDRALRALALGLTGDTDDHLVPLLLAADPELVDDLRARVLAPLADLRPATVEKLVETLRAWLLHHGRREEVAAALFVHPQTVRYRMGQLRDRFGDRLEDPDTVLALTLALARS